jgi:hypothetical protein
MARSKNKYKGHRESGGFLSVPHTVLNSSAFTSLSSHAVKLLLDLGVQYRGHNNGDLSIAWKVMRARGWCSQTTLHKAKVEAIEKGFIFETRKGHRPNTCSLFALTWKAIDPNDKYDAWAMKAFTFNAFKVGDIAPAIKAHKNASLTPPNGSTAPT